MPDESPATYAVWKSESTGAEVNYSLRLFHEIDFYVNEGFRRIAHGGVETGGILFGRIVEGKLHLEAFRPIVSEHAFGPSFVLSDSDLDRLRKQLKESTSDPELQGLSIVGWFIGHTRHDLVLSDREAEWFKRLFPKSGQVTVLVKPERFQPTRFGFVVRTAGDLPVDARHGAVILPLSARTVDRGAVASSVKEATSAPSIPAELSEAEVPSPAQPPPNFFESPIAPLAAPATQASTASPSATPIAASPSELPTLPSRSQRQGRSIWTVAGWLLLCAAVAATAFRMYLQLVPMAIPLTVSGRPPIVTLEWPAHITAGVDQANLRIGNQAPEPLSSEQKQFGTARVTAPTSDTRIELVVYHWFYEERGVVRLLSQPESAPKRTVSPNPADLSTQR